VPPLRERRAEISHLTEFFMSRYARRYNRPARQLTETLQQLFQRYEWPGNIRELENMIKRIVILQDEQLVVREMTRAPRSLHAYAGAGAARGTGALGGVATDERPAAGSEDGVDSTVDETADVADDAADEAAEPEVPVVMAPAGSRLADVAKSAALKAERAIIEDTLTQVQWNRRRAAEQLGVSYKTLLNKIKECGIARKQ